MSADPDALPPADHGARRDRLRERLAGADLAALLVTELVNVRYLTGFTGSNAQLLVAADAEADLFVTDGRYETQSEWEVADLPRLIERARVYERVLERVREARLPALGFESHALSWEAGERVRELARAAGVVVRGVARPVEGLREVKDAHELAALGVACALTSSAFEAIVDTLLPGRTELEVATLLERNMVDLGADGPAFDTIVASGPNSAIPHHRPGRRRFELGDLVKIDAGARYAGYHADMTRTFALGDPGEELRRVADLVRRAQAAGVAAALAGAEARAVDASCRDLLTEAGYGERFTHSTGHGVGLAIHEAPTLGKDSDATLAAGMTVTVEPGVYLAGVGGVRIEDTLVVAEDGPPEVLTHADRELLVL